MPGIGVIWGIAYKSVYVGIFSFLCYAGLYLLGYYLGYKFIYRNRGKDKALKVSAPETKDVYAWKMCDVVVREKSPKTKLVYDRYGYIAEISPKTPSDIIYDLEDGEVDTYDVTLEPYFFKRSNYSYNLFGSNRFTDPNRRDKNLLAIISSEAYEQSPVNKYSILGDRDARRNHIAYFDREGRVVPLSAGFYVFKKLKEALNEFKSERGPYSKLSSLNHGAAQFGVLARVRIYGFTVEAKEGYQTEYMDIVGLYVLPGRYRDLTKKLIEDHLGWPFPVEIIN